MQDSSHHATRRPELTTPTSVGPARAVALVAGPATFLLLIALPVAGTGGAGQRLAAIFAWVIVYWLTEALPLSVTALLSSGLAIVLGVGSATRVLAPYADPVIFLFVGSFILAEAMRETDLDRRFALGLPSHPWSVGHPHAGAATRRGGGDHVCGLAVGQQHGDDGHDAADRPGPVAGAGPDRRCGRQPLPGGLPAIVYGSGSVPLSEMIRAGAVLDLIGIAVIWLSLRWLCPLVGVM